MATDNVYKIPQVSFHEHRYLIWITSHNGILLPESNTIIYIGRSLGFVSYTLSGTSMGTTWKNSYPTWVINTDSYTNNLYIIKKAFFVKCFQESIIREKGFFLQQTLAIEGNISTIPKELADALPGDE